MLILVLAIASLVGLAGCAGSVDVRTTRRSSSSAASANTPPTLTVPPAATAPIGPTQQPTVTPGFAPCETYASKWSGVVRVGDLLVMPAFTDPEGTFYPLPVGTPLQPLKVPVQSTSGQFAGWPTGTLGATGVYAAVCNASPAIAHSIQGARVKLTAFAAYPGQLSAWDFCGGFYARPAGVTPSNCDRGSAPTDEAMQAIFASNAQPGTVVVATQPGPTPGDGFGPLPAVLPPGSIMYLNIGLTAPTTPGTYTFAVSITTDGASLPFTGGTSMLLAPIAHTWNGQACTSASMLAQIPPATNPPTPYICPVG